MVGRHNEHQLDDLLRRLLTSGRSNRFIDYWNKSPNLHTRQATESGALKEVAKGDVKMKRGHPSTSEGRLTSVAEIFKKTGDISTATT